MRKGTYMKHQYIKLLPLVVSLTFAMPTLAVAENSIAGSLSKEELVTLNGTSSDTGNQLSRERVSTGEETYDRLKFTEKQSYDFKADHQLPSYLALKVTSSSRLKVMPDMRIRFAVKAGSLMENMGVLFSHTSGGKPYFHKNFPDSLRFYNDFYITGDNVADLMNQMIEPWREKHTAHAYAHLNNIVEFTVSN